MKLLMCRPTAFQVDYNINPWMANNIGKVDTSLALRQWDIFYNKLKEYAEIALIRQRVDAPDMVFTANAGLVRNDIAILSHFNSVERSVEEDIFREWFLAQGYTIIQNTGAPFEGAGDFLSGFGYNENYFGHGFRSSLKAGETINVPFHRAVWYPLKLIDNRFYHLDTCFCPLDEESVLCFPNAIETEDLIRATREMKLITVTEEEALKFACNAVVIGKNIFMPECFSVADKLDKLGYNVHVFNMSEFIKSGGACKCLTLEI